MQLVYLMYVGPLESGERGGKLELILLLKNKRFWYVRVRRAFQMNKNKEAWWGAFILPPYSSEMLFWLGHKGIEDNWVEFRKSLL